MSKAFTKETDGAADDGDEDDVDILPVNAKNYMTPWSLKNLKAELRRLRQEERPKVVEIVSWAAGNGDRSENGDYIYGKKRLREIDRRLRYLMKRIESAEIVDPRQQKMTDQVFFGATVTFERDRGQKQTVRIVGVDEADLNQGKISWLSPVARALMKSKIGDMVDLRTPSGHDTLAIRAIVYEGEAS